MRTLFLAFALVALPVFAHAENRAAFSEGNAIPEIGREVPGAAINETEAPGGLKLQGGGDDVRCRNALIRELDLEQADTDFKE